MSVTNFDSSSGEFESIFKITLSLEVNELRYAFNTISRLVCFPNADTQKAVSLLIFLMGDCFATCATLGLATKVFGCRHLGSSYAVYDFAQLCSLAV